MIDDLRPSEADKDLAGKIGTPQPSPFVAVPVKWCSDTRIQGQSPTLCAAGPSHSPACPGLASPGELSPPPGLPILCFLASLGLSASFRVCLSDLAPPSFSVLPTFRIGFPLTLLFHILCNNFMPPLTCCPSPHLDLHQPSPAGGQRARVPRSAASAGQAPRSLSSLGKGES